MSGRNDPARKVNDKAAFSLRSPGRGVNTDRPPGKTGRAARGIAKRELGRLDEAEEDLRFAIRIAEELGDRQLPGWTWRALARVSELRGNQAEAEERHRRSREAIVRGPR